MHHNVILNDVYREKYAKTIEYFYEKFPTLMQRKIPRANIQQAWMYNKVLEFSNTDSHVLCVGNHEDTAYYALRSKMPNLIGIDPLFDYDLASYRQQTPQKFNIVFSTSVIEHVVDDESFIADMCAMLNDNGVGIITCDFNDDYPNVPKPLVDVRLYTSYDLTVRIPAVLQQYNCTVLGDFEYHNNIDFEYEGCRYGFATLTFRKDAM
jgi:hypothetical protein